MRKFPLLITLVLLVLPIKILAEDLDSSSFEIVDFTIGKNATPNQQSTNYSLLLSNDEITSLDRFNSANYQIRAANTNTWLAHTPVVQCFETSSNGSTLCDNPNVSLGMVQICGYGGCYNKARFEIDTQNNPTDTLYSVQITTDPTWATWDYIDGSTFLLEDESFHDLNDYITESAWETPDINILGLQVNTIYYLRITALHGNFTESEPSPDLNTQTSLPSITFDIDIAGSGGGATETSAPYAVDLGNLSVGSVSTATNLIWIDFGTNSNNGGNVYIKDLYNGLYSPSRTYTLPSSNTDLSSNTGYGVLTDTITQITLGPLAPETDYNNGGDFVGELINSSGSKKIFNSSGNPLLGGRASILVKARPANTTPASNDYTDTITFTVSGNI